MTRRGASLTAMLVPTVWRMEWGEMALVMPAARTYFLTIFWTERVVRGLSLPTLEVKRGLRESGWEVKLRSLAVRSVGSGATDLVRSTRCGPYLPCRGRAKAPAPPPPRGSL